MLSSYWLFFFNCCVGSCLADNINPWVDVVCFGSSWTTSFSSSGRRSGSCSLLSFWIDWLLPTSKFSFSCTCPSLLSWMSTSAADYWIFPCLKAFDMLPFSPLLAFLFCWQEHQNALPVSISLDNYYTLYNGFEVVFKTYMTCWWHKMCAQVECKDKVEVTESRATSLS